MPRQGQRHRGEGAKNSDPSSWSCRQFRHLVDAFLDAGCVLQVRDRFALTGADGMTWRPDKAPDDLRAAYEERQRRAQEEAEHQRQEMEARYESMMAARREGRVQGRGAGLFGGDEFRMISMAEAIGRMHVLRPPEPMPVTEWAGLYLGQPWVDEVDNGDTWSGRVFTNAPRYGVVHDGEGQPAAYLVPPLTGRAGIDLGERPAAPTPPLQQRLMTGFAQASLTPKPKAREPPLARPPRRSREGRFGTMVTARDVEMARRCRPMASSLMSMWSWIWDRVLSNP